LLKDEKHGYLVSKKLGQLKKAGLANLNRDELASLIKSKVTANYIYEMVINEQNEMQFNVMLEIEGKDGGFPTRLKVVLEYLPTAKVLRVITMY
jgi:hypothetical protein